MYLASLGFLIIGVLFGCYAVSFYSLARKRFPDFPTGSYACAYFSLAVAFILWAVAALYNPFPQTSIIVGDAFILFGSLFLLNVMTSNNPKIKVPVLIVGVIGALLILWLRTQYFPPVAFVESGVLVFNTQLPIAVLLDALFILIWLPANILVARRIAQAIRIEGVALAYSFVYAISSISAILLIAFKTVPLVVASFVVLGVCFILLFVSNYVMSNLLPQKA